MTKPGLKQRLRYRIDTFLARGSGALFMALVVGFLVSLAVVTALRFILHQIDPNIGAGMLRQVWVTFLQLTDPGNMAQDNDTPGIFKFAAVVAGLTGVVIFSALIAFLTTALDQAISHLKKGHSQVLETGHTLILGWGPRVLEILRELLEANESEKDPVIVILADEEKEEMDELLRSALPDWRGTRIVTRSGPGASLLSLKRVSARAAKSAIVLASCDPAATADEKLASDARVIKTVLALDAVLDPAAEFSVVAEIFTPRNRQVATDISPERVCVVDAEEILAKIMVQTSRTSGLAVVYSELLSFEGCEMYFYRAAWNGIPFGHVQFHFHDGVPIGIRKADGTLVMRSGLGTALANDDEILIVADDDSSIQFTPQPVMQPQEWDVPGQRVEQRIERQLLLGWSGKAATIIREYADYVLEGSVIDVMIKDPPASVTQEIETLNQLGSVSVNLINRDPLVSDELASLQPFSYNNVIILPQKPEAEVDAERVDSETIVVLLHLRKMQRELEKAGHTIGTRLLTEVLDSSNQELINQAGVDDFIISNRMVSMIFAQLSEEPTIKAVYDDLFQEEGSEIYVKPAWLYFHSLPVTCRFGDLMRLAQKRDAEVCIGYKLGHLEQDSAQNFGVKLIPPKDSMVTITAADALVVVAEDDR